MPAHATHMSVLDLAAKKAGALNHDLGSILSANMDIAYLGAIAPDMYFLAPDISQSQKDLMYWLFGMYDDVISPIIGLYEDYVKPVQDVLDDITEPVKTTLDSLTCGVLKDLGDNVDDVVERATDAMETFLLDAATHTVNLFQLFTPPIQEGKAEKDWYWFDMLHYRRTSDYVVELVRSLPGPGSSQSDYEAGLAYAVGHLSHIAGDVTGHPYVNEIVGGPYRAHNRRHHIVENFIDVWVHDHYHEEELIGAKLHRKLAGGTTLDELGTLRAVAESALDPPERLGKLFQRLELAFPATYGNVPHPTRLDSEYLTRHDISIAYWLSLAFLKMSTDCLLPPIDPPQQELLEEINNFVDGLKDAIGDTPDAPDAPDLCWTFWSDDCDLSWEAFKSFMEFVWESIVYTGKCLLWALNVLKELLVGFACILMETMVLPLKGILWLIRQLITELHQTFRDGLVVAGIALPTIDYVKSSPLGKAFTSSYGPLESFRQFPHRQSKSSLVGGLLFPSDSHLEHPTTQGERELTLNGPYAEGRSPVCFIEDTAMDETLLSRFAQAVSPEETRAIEKEILTTGQAIGNAVDYTVAMALGIYDMWKGGPRPDLPNWNLDGDRGYGYKCWAAGNPDAVLPESSEPVSEEYV